MHTIVDSYLNLGHSPGDYHDDNRSYCLVTAVTTAYNNSTINPILEHQLTGELLILTVYLCDSSLFTLQTDRNIGLIQSILGVFHAIASSEVGLVCIALHTSLCITVLALYCIIV